MINKFIILFLGLLTLTFTCCKNKPLTQNEVSEKLFGEYQWEYSQLSGTNLLGPGDVVSSYGLRINEEGLFYLKNGEVINHFDNAVIYYPDIGTSYIHVFNPTNSQVINYGNGRPPIDLDVLDIKNFPFECRQEFYLITGNYFKRVGTDIEVKCECSDYSDSIAGSYIGYLTKQIFTGMVNDIPQFDTLQHSLMSINLNHLIKNTVADTAACVFQASNYFTDTLFIRDFYGISNFEFSADFYQNHGKDYWQQSVTKTGNLQTFEFYERDVYTNQNNKAIVYYPFHFIGYK